MIRFNVGDLLRYKEPLTPRGGVAFVISTSPTHFTVQWISFVDHASQNPVDLKTLVNHFRRGNKDLASNYWEKIQ